MTTVSYRSFTGTAAENYERYFVPAIATPVSVELLGDRRPAARRARPRRRLRHRSDRPARRRAGRSDRHRHRRRHRPRHDRRRNARPSPLDHRMARRRRRRHCPFADEAYDVVLCQMGLMFMADRHAAVAEMRRVAAAGGRVVVNTPGAIQPLFALMEQAIVDHISADLGGFVRAVFSMHDPDDVASLLRDAGLVDVTATTSTATLNLGAPAEFLWQYINLTPMGTARRPSLHKGAGSDGTRRGRVVAAVRPQRVDVDRPADGGRVRAQLTPRLGEVSVQPNPRPTASTARRARARDLAVRRDAR